MRTYWLIAALMLSALLFGLHYWAMENYMYWKWFWLDIPMHFLGGLATSTFVLAFLGGRQTRVFILAMICVFIGWEVFEYVFKLPQPLKYPIDTAKDLFDDSMGALLAYFLATKTLWKIK